MRVHCACGKTLTIPDRYAGKKVKCPACEEVTIAPGSASFEDDEADFGPKSRRDDRDDDRIATSRGSRSAPAHSVSARRSRQGADYEDEFDSPSGKKAGRAPAGRKGLRIFLGILGVLMIGAGTTGVIWGFYLRSKDKSAGPLDPGRKLPVAIEQISQEVGTNPTGAAQQYNGKKIALSGKVRSVASDGASLELTIIERLTKTKGIPCKVDEASRDKARALIPGQNVMMKATPDIKGKELKLTGGEIESVGPDPTVTITAEQLTQELAMQRPGTIPNHLGSMLVVEGTVGYHALPDDLGVGTFYLNGFQPKAKNAIRISVTYSKENAEKFAGITKGQKVKLKGVFDQFRSSPLGPRFVDLRGASVVK